MGGAYRWVVGGRPVALERSGGSVDIVPEFNTACFLSIDDRVRDAVTAFPLHRTGDAETILKTFVEFVVGGGTLVVRPYEYEIFDLSETCVARAWGWKRSQF